MSWFYSVIKPAEARDHASAVEIVACFKDQRFLLSRLAFLISGDQLEADQCVTKACEMTLHGNAPFRDWLLEWAKTATIAGAITQRSTTIRSFEAKYDAHHCTHVEHLAWDDSERAAILCWLLQTNPQRLVIELDALCRAVLILRIALRSSVQDCALRLNVPRSAVVAASCHLTTWLHWHHVMLSR
jgi:hypothetical protein